MAGHARNVTRLRNFVNSRPAFISSFPDFQHESPQIIGVQQLCLDNECPAPLSGEEVRITAGATHPQGIKKLRLYYGSGLKGRFQVREMEYEDGLYSATIPGMAAGT
ncbi:MAG: hypothetical protein GY790_15110 [Bacteroidetes bacterium]|nr:hypothetical protein [Bacteroidota bacterium]